MTRNTAIGAGLAAVVAAMVGLSFASVPLYRVFCSVTGYNGRRRSGRKPRPAWSASPSPWP